MAFKEQVQFYRSKAWKQTQAAFMASKNYMCERCDQPATIVHHKTYITPSNINDPNITLSWDNLEALCHDCHNKEHFREAATMPGLVFDSNGNLIKRQAIVLRACYSQSGAQRIDSESGRAQTVGLSLKPIISTLRGGLSISSKPGKYNRVECKACKVSFISSLIFLFIAL